MHEVKSQWIARSAYRWSERSSLSNTLLSNCVPFQWMTLTDFIPSVNHKNSSVSLRINAIIFSQQIWLSYELISSTWIPLNTR